MSGGKLSDRAALITGASSGIGRAVARRFAAEGARLALVGRSASGLAETVAGLESESGAGPAPAPLCLTADLAEPASWERVVEETVDGLGALDVLVNAAGIIDSGTLEHTAPEDWRAMMTINVDAVYGLMRAALPFLRRRGGRVVNVSSVTGRRAFPGVLAYCVSKAAVDQLTRCAALELAADGVRVNAVNPGVVRTELHRRGGMAESAYEEFLEHSRSTHPLGRVGEPDDIAAAILFLACDDSDWITGETLSIDGGRHLTCAR